MCWHVENNACPLSINIPTVAAMTTLWKVKCLCAVHYASISRTLRSNLCRPATLIYVPAESFLDFMFLTFATSPFCWTGGAGIREKWVNLIKFHWQETFAYYIKVFNCKTTCFICIWLCSQDRNTSCLWNIISVYLRDRFMLTLRLPD